MPSSENRPLPFLLSLPVPAVAEIDRIAAMDQPILRNLQITQCYSELSVAFAERTGPCANWCTFAVWASKQAGQTIRREDLVRILEFLLRKEPDIQQALLLIATVAKQLGARQTLEQIRRSALGSLVSAAAARAGDAVSRGNKKVFEEIARLFSLFMTTCFSDTTYTAAHIEDFCRQLRPGPPPDGQEYLRRAFTRYYGSMFEEDPKKQAELRYLANLETGFHEQTRLQPEIAESLNTAAIDPQQVKKHLLAILFPGTDHTGRLRFFFQNLFQKTALLDKAVEALVQRAKQHLRRILTAHLMTLNLPPNNCLRLGRDLTTIFPVHLKEPASQDLLALLALIDPTPGSLLESGATDWSDLPERLHYIADLFRCYHETKELFDPPFTAEQVSALKAGRLPQGRL